MKRITYTLLLASLTTIVFAGGGWPQKKGHGYLKLAEWWITADQHFTGSGLIDPNLTSGIYNTSLYAEYGVTDRLTVKAYVPFFSRATVNNQISATTGELIAAGDAINTFGDTDLTLTYGLSAGKINTTASLTLGIPLGNPAGGRDLNLQTGDGEFNQMVQVDAGIGYKIKKTEGYANAYVAYNNRTQGFSDEYRFGIESGVFFWDKKLLTIIRAYGVLSTFNGVENAFANSTSIFANNAEHISIGPEVNYFIGKDWGISAGVTGAVWGRLIFARPSYTVGAFARF